MRILQITASMDAEAGGPPRVVAGMTRSLEEQGYPQTVLTTHVPGGRRVFVNCSVFSRPRRPPRFWYMADGLDTILSDQARNADLLHLHEVWSYPQYLGARYGTKARKPYLVTPHGELGPKHMRHKGAFHHWKKRAYLRTVGRRVVFGAACLHVFTEAEAMGLRAAGYRGPVTVVPNGIDFAEFSKLPPTEAAEERWPELKGRQVVLFMSRLSPEKGLCRLIPAWKEIVRRKPLSDALLVLAGPSDRGYGRNVDQLVTEHALKRHVLRTGLVTGEDRLKLLSRAELYTLPSFSEGFSMSLLEAMACAKVTVYTPECNFPEAAEAGAGFCVEPSVTKLRDTLTHCLELSAAERKRLGDAARRLIQDSYTWDTVAAKMRTVYECILDGRHIPRHPQPSRQAVAGLRPAA